MLFSRVFTDDHNGMIGSLSRLNSHCHLASNVKCRLGLMWCFFECASCLKLNPVEGRDDRYGAVDFEDGINANHDSGTHI